MIGPEPAGAAREAEPVPTYELIGSGHVPGDSSPGPVEHPGRIVVLLVMLAVGAFLKACPRWLVAEHAARLENEMQDEGTFERVGRFGRMGRYVRPSFKQWSDGIERSGPTPTPTPLRTTTPAVPNPRANDAVADAPSSRAA